MGGSHCGRVHAHLVRAQPQQAANLPQARDTAADGEGDEYLFGYAGRHVQQGRAPLVRGVDVQQHQLVCPSRVVRARAFHRIARVADGDEVDALDDAPVPDVQAGDNALGQHVTRPLSATQSF